MDAPYPVLYPGLWNMDPLSFFAAPDPAIYHNAYPDPAVHYEEFGVIDLLPVPTTGFCSHFIIYFVFKF